MPAPILIWSPGALDFATVPKVLPSPLHVWYTFALWLWNYSGIQDFCSWLEFPPVPFVWVVKPLDPSRWVYHSVDSLLKDTPGRAGDSREQCWASWWLWMGHREDPIPPSWTLSLSWLLGTPYLWWTSLVLLHQETAMKNCISFAITRLSYP